MEYDAREYYWNIDDGAPVVIGFDIDEIDCDTILLPGVSSYWCAHILMSGDRRIGDWSEIDCGAGDYIRTDKLITSSERTNIVYLGERYARISR